MPAHLGPLVISCYLPSLFYVTEFGESMTGVNVFDAFDGTVEICRKQVQAISPIW